MAGTSDVGRAAVAGFIATFIATRWGYLETAVGLPRFDFNSATGSLIVHAGASPAFTYNWGAIVHYIDGVILTILYGRFIYSRLPGPDIFRGVIYGILVWIGAGLVYFPLAGAGLFGALLGGPLVWAVFIWHIVWGIALGILFPGPYIGERGRSAESGGD